MNQSGISSYFIGILVLWSIWAGWNSIDPVLSGSQLIALFIFLPLSALLIAFAFVNRDKDDDDFGGGLMQPVLQRVKG